MIEFVCDGCQRRVSADDSRIGGRFECPRCKAIQIVPSVEAALLQRAARRTLPDSPPGPESEFVVYERPVAKTSAAATVGPPDMAVASPHLPVEGRRRSRRLRHVTIFVTALVAFAIGVASGRKYFSREIVPVATRPSTLRGHVFYATGSGRQFADAGSLIALLPADLRPETRLSARDLQPAATPPTGNSAVSLIRQLGGDVTWVGTDASFELQVTSPGDYHLLCLSRHVKRRRVAEPSRRLLAEIGHYAGPAYDLLANHAYRWEPLQLDRDQERDVIFEP